eukprot:comp19964_c0_seq1/m.38940 comp19964_c0_seq1/g.38940  ORF comp19964_c0_seq1/g.38940 comp19964_c0_seq1/m.38940 type:complete len:160 (+) comp19964_c0_seq1:120-599(+)
MLMNLPARGDFEGPPTEEVYGAPVRLQLIMENGNVITHNATIGQTVAQIKKKLHDNGLVDYGSNDFYLPNAQKPLLDPFSLNDFPAIAAAAHGQVFLFVRRKENGPPPLNAPLPNLAGDNNNESEKSPLKGSKKNPQDKYAVNEPKELKDSKKGCCIVS